MVKMIIRIFRKLVFYRISTEMLRLYRAMIGLDPRKGRNAQISIWKELCNTAIIFVKGL